jgi:hypothetical protein
MAFPAKMRAIGRKSAVQRVAVPGHHLGQLPMQTRRWRGQREREEVSGFVELSTESSEKFPWSAGREMSAGLRGTNNRVTAHGPSRTRLKSVPSF